jgi:hypothetical protein
MHGRFRRDRCLTSIMIARMTQRLKSADPLEGIAGIEAALEELPLARLCFGSYAAVFDHESTTPEAAGIVARREPISDHHARNGRRFLAR